MCTRLPSGMSTRSAIYQPDGRVGTPLGLRMSPCARHYLAMTDTPGRATGRLREATAEEIRVLLARRNMSAAELARQTGIKQSYISRRMTGETPFDLDDLELIAAALEVPVVALLPTEAQVATALDVEVIRSRPQRTRPAHRQSGRQTTVPKLRRTDRPSDGRPKGRPDRQVTPPNIRRPERVDAPRHTTPGPSSPPARRGGRPTTGHLPAQTSTRPLVLNSALTEDH